MVGWISRFTNLTYFLKMTVTFGSILLFFCDARLYVCVFDCYMCICVLDCCLTWCRKLVWWGFGKWTAVHFVYPYVVWMVRPPWKQDAATSLQIENWLLLPDDRWSEEPSKQRTLIWFEQSMSWGKWALPVWARGHQAPRRSWIHVGQRWLEVRGRNQRESHSPTSLTGWGLAREGDSSTWKAAMSQKWKKKNMVETETVFIFFVCEASQIGRIATSLHNWDLKPRPKSTRCQDWRTVRGKRHLEPSSKVGHCTDLQCKRDCLGRWSEIKNRGGSIRGRSGSQRV